MKNCSIAPCTVEYDIEKSIVSHPAWAGNICGLEGETFINGKPPYSFLLRQGEKNSHYYITFMAADGSIRHQPFCIIYSREGWYCQQGGRYGPFIIQAIDDLIHQIIHCKPEECRPIDLS